jgi:hypothetical protein
MYSKGEGVSQKRSMSAFGGKADMARGGRARKSHPSIENIRRRPIEALADKFKDFEVELYKLRRVIEQPSTER